VVVLQHGAAVCEIEALEAAVLATPASAGSSDAAGC
jgi:hypothetical protein